MSICIRKSEIKDVNSIVSMRISLLDEMSGPLTQDEKQKLYDDNKLVIEEAIKTINFISFVALDGENYIGTCSITLYTVMPGKKLPNGKQGYLQNMYIHQDYRRKGLGMDILKKTIEEAVNRGHTKITLHATEQGYGLFEKYGFKAESVSLSHMVFELH